MKYSVLVKPKSRSEKVEKVDEKTLRVWVKAPPVEGRANDAVIKLLAEYFSVPKSRITFVTGTRGRHKIIEVSKESL